MRKLLLFTVLLSTLCSFFSLLCYAQDTLTITTYYPSPYGSYRELRAQRMAIGDDYIKGSEYCWEGTCTNTINPNADLVVEGSVGIGTASPTGILEILNDNEVYSWESIVNKKYKDNDNAPNIVFLKARGSADSPADVLDGDGLGRFHFSGLEGGNWLYGGGLNSWGGIDILVDGDPSPASHPSMIIFKTTQQGSIANEWRMAIKNDGKVGIGTANPISKLQAVSESPTIDSDNDITMSSYTSSSFLDPAFITQKARGTESSPQAILAGDNIGGLFFQGHDGSNFRSAAGIQGKAEKNFTPANQTAKLEFFTADSGSNDIRMTILGSGNVGIGTPSPTGILTIGDFNTVRDVVFNSPNTLAAGSAFQFRENDSWSGFQIQHDTDINRLNFAGYSGGAKSSDIMTFERDSGKVGIGTTEPKHKLHVAGQTQFTADATNDVWIQGGDQNWDPDFAIREKRNLALVGLVATDKLWLNFGGEYTGGTIIGGNVGIGEPSPNVALDVIGSIEYTGTCIDVSDERLKENIKIINEPIKKLANIKGIYFNMIGSEKKELGVIAQDVQRSLPEAVSVVDEEEGYLGVSYVSLIPVLIEAVKEQQMEIENLKSEINDLKQKPNL
ncbi:MAG: tail fiber domain-containing protein [Candidatus Omnitrophota bacterium]